jgi:hypothetical protein
MPWLLTIFLFLISSRFSYSAIQSPSLFLEGDFLYFKREHVADKPLVGSVSPMQPDVIDTEDLVHEFSYEPGFRVKIGSHLSQKSSVEGNYLWINSWTASKKATGLLFFPFEDPNYTHDMNLAESARARYRSTFQGGEFNYWRHVTPRFGDYFSFSYLAGISLFSVSESSQVRFRKHSRHSTYQIETSNWMGGIQVGANLQVCPYSFMSWDLTPKIGLLCNRAGQKTNLGDLNNQIIIRDFDETAYKETYLATTALSLTLQPGQSFHLMVDYEFLYLGNLSLAAEQYSYSVGSTSGKKLKIKSYIVLQGLSAGIGYRF